MSEHEPVAGLSEGEVEQHVCCVKPSKCRDDHFHQRDVERIVAAHVARATAEAEARGRAQVMAEAEARQIPHPAGVALRQDNGYVNVQTMRLAVAALDAAPAAPDPQEHTHETGGAWHVTRWTVPGCPACEAQR